MAKLVVIDEFHLTVRVPAHLPDADVEAVRRTLAGNDFMDQLWRALGAIVQAFPDLARVRISVTR